MDEWAGGWMGHIIYANIDGCMDEKMNRCMGSRMGGRMGYG